MTNELWIISLTVFVTALLGIEAVYWLVFESRHRRQSINRRLARSKRAKNPTEFLEALRHERGLAEIEALSLRRLNEFLTQSGVSVDRNLLLLSVLGLSIILFFGFGLVFGYGLLAVVGGSSSALVVTYLFFSVVRQKRIARFAEQLPDAIDVIVRGVRVGLPLPAALALVAREMPDPIGTEFGLASDEVAFGQDLKLAMENLYRRVGQDDVQFLVVAVNVQSQTGGNLAEILSRLSRLVRSRGKLQLKIRALSAEGRISAKFLSVMPVALLAVISLISPKYFAEVRHHPLMEPALAYAAVSLLVGNIVMYRMVNFKF